MQGASPASPPWGNALCTATASVGLRAFICSAQEGAEALYPLKPQPAGSSPPAGFFGHVRLPSMFGRLCAFLLLSCHTFSCLQIGNLGSNACLLQQPNGCVPP